MKKFTSLLRAFTFASIFLGSFTFVRNAQATVCDYSCQGAGGCVSRPCSNPAVACQGGSFSTTWGGTCSLVKGPYEQPVIFSIFPTTVAAGDTVTISGSGFVTVQTLSLNGVNFPPSSASTTSISFVVSNTMTSGVIAVNTPNGTAISSNLAVVPRATSVLPRSGVVGTLVTVSGTNLAPLNTLTLGGVDIKPIITEASATGFKFAAPAGASGILIATTSGGSTRFGPFTLILPVPRITGFSPTSGTLGTRVTINGANFAGITEVTIGGVSATGITILSPTQMTALVGTQSRNDVINVTNNGGTATTLGSTLGNSANGKFESLCDPIIDERRTLAMNDASIRLDACRTNFPGSPNAGANCSPAAAGHWNFSFLMSQMAPSGMSTSTFIKKWLLNWQKTTSVNALPIGSAASGVNMPLLTNWVRTTGAPEFDGTAPLDLNQGPFTLASILFRPDLDGTSSTPSAGEGRFVFSNFGGKAVIFEYKLPVSMGSVPTSAADWNLIMHDLSTATAGTDAYSSALQAATDRFAMKNFAGVAGMVNGSGINQVRTNQFFEVEGLWALREFRLTGTAVSAAVLPSGTVVAAGPGELVSFTTKESNPASLNATGSAVETWVSQNSAGVIAGTAHMPPDLWGGRSPTQTAISFNSLTPPARKAYEMSTCGGCHAPSNSGSGFLMVNLTSGSFAPFMTGVTGAGAGAIGPDGFARQSNSPFIASPVDAAGNRVLNYSDLHARSKNLINKVISGFCR